MGEVVSFPKGNLLAAQVGDPLWPVMGPVAPPASWPQVVEDWIMLLDDILARHDWLTGATGVQVDDLTVWIADARRLLHDIARQPVNIRMASTIATRIIALKICLDPQGSQDLAEARRGLSGQGGDAPSGGLMSEARAENNRLKGLLQRTPCASPADDFADPLDDDVSGFEAGERALASEASFARGTYPVPAPRRTERLGQRVAALGLEACSVRFHFTNLCVALAAFLRAGWQWLIAHIVMDDPFAPWALPDDAPLRGVSSVPVHAQSLSARRALLADGTRVSHVRGGVMRKDADDFLTDEFPAGTPDGAA
tara:strand:- start:3909 stop:4841 length:933 start_codon:yes stop_codon:yes gene_type:complete